MDNRYTGGLLCLFLALTARDMLFANGNGEEFDTEADFEPYSEMKIHQGKPSLMVEYCYSCGYKKAFEEYSFMLSQKYPDLVVVGSNYPPPPLKHYLAQSLLVLKMATISLIIMSINPFTLMGFDTPTIWTWLSSNRVYGCLMTFFIINMIEGQLISTGAFEISYNGVPVWSKLQNGRIPSPPELFQIIDGHNLVKADLHSQRLS
ncbi:putative thioredoxin reductase-like selenoprotein T protein [Halotydeus destructor]|nr:putative thioredoxin reductase-like selenoprotein T protein [Halotydeus destructor]